MFHLREAYEPPIVSARRRRSQAQVGDVHVGAPPASVRVGGVEDDLEGANTVDKVDAVFRKRLKAGDVPDYIAKTGWWGGRVVITGGGHTLEILVAPDYGAVGSDDDPFRIGNESESFAQEYVDAFDSILPSQKLLREIEAQADPKIPYIPVQLPSGGEDATISGLIRANNLANKAFDKHGVTTTDGRLKIGYRKAYVVRPGLDGSYIAIYGGRWTAAGGLVQPTSGHAHTAVYSGPSHGIVLVSRKARLDGEDVDLVDDVFLSDDPSVVALASDEGSFDPKFPNAGASVVGKYSSGAGIPGSGGGSKVSSSVASVQRALVGLGYDIGYSGVDGKLGPDTRAAISAFRRDRGLPDGGIDDALVSALNKVVEDKVGSASGGYTTYLALGAALVLAVGVVYYLA